MTTKLENGWPLRNKILEGVNTLADYVATTLGPKGQNVLIHQKGKTPFITKDGVTVAQNISFEDPFINAGAEVVKQVSAMTNAEAGDGTTTSTILAREILLQAHKHIEAGVSPIEIKRGLERCSAAACEGIADLARPVSSVEDIRHVACISANNDIVIGNLVATAVDKVGKNGSISVEDARSHETILELVEGFKFESGYAARAFVTDERRGLCKYDNPIFLITDHKIEHVQDILPALEIAARENRPFIIIADDIEGQALAALIMNTVRGSMKVAAVKAPSYGEDRRGILSDLAVATGSKFFQQSLGHKLGGVSLVDFGKARSIEISKSKTTIVDAEGDYEGIDSRIEEIKNEIVETEDMHTAARLQDRITRLSSGVAIIKVGANSEVELTEKKHRIEDALEAVNSAQQEGVILGGGMSLVRISAALNIDFPNEEQAVALPIFKKALLAPFETMARNAGHNPEVLRLTIGECTETEGYNFLTSKKEDLFNSGVIDPAKVTRCALKNAVSVASTLLLTNHSIIQD
jgi:chaperonin GroEL